MIGIFIAKHERSRRGVPATASFQLKVDGIIGFSSKGDSMRTIRSTLTLSGLLVLSPHLGGAAAAASAQHVPTTAVLVHGALADGSSWTKVIALLDAKGLRVVAVQNPLTSLKDHVDATKGVIDEAPGPVVLLGHSWGGQVIAEAGTADKVVALVNVAAFAFSEPNQVAKVIINAASTLA